MDAGFELKLIECLNLLDEGEQVERILARYPQEAEQLRALLEVAAALPALRIEPTEAARIDSRRAFLGQAHELREMAPPWRFWLPTRLALGLAALVLAFLFVGGAVAASSSALPNDPLYLVKRAAEDARLLLAPQADQPSLAEQFEQRRRDEIARLLGERSSADVAFDGRIEAIQPGRWMVSGLPVQVEGATPVSGTPGINARVHMQGRTENGQLRATSIQIEPGTGLPPTATPTATSAPTATAQPSATSLPTPTATATARPSATPTPRAVPTASATRPPTKVPAALPAPEPTSQPETPPTQAPPPSPEPDPEDEAEFTGTVESRDFGTANSAGPRSKSMMRPKFAARLMSAIRSKFASYASPMAGWSPAGSS